VHREQIALRALGAYPITPSRIAFLRHNETMVFQVGDERAARTYLLRIHAPRIKSFVGERLHPGGITSELLWLEALSEETTVGVQRPVRSNEDALVTLIAGEQGEIPCSLLHWIEADPFPPLPRQTTLSGLEQRSRRFIPTPPPGRHHNPLFVRCMISHSIAGRSTHLLTAYAAALSAEGDFLRIQETLELVLTTLTATEGRLILIHADLWQSNLLVSKTAVHPIDFSLCGFGFPLFDLGTCLPGIPAQLRPMLLDAYHQQAQLPETSPRLIDACFLLCRMGAAATQAATGNGPFYHSAASAACSPA
jgi:hypothetical protein